MHGGEQAQLVEHGRVHLLGLVDQQHRAQEGGLQMSQPALAQGLEAAPAVMGLELDGEQIAHLAVEIGQIGAGMADGPDADLGQLAEALVEQAQHRTLAGTGIALDQGKAAFADQRVLDAPAELLHGRGDVQCLGGQLRGEGIELQPIEGEQRLVHGVGSGSSCLGR